MSFDTAAWTALIAASAATYFWRWLGVRLSGNLDLDGPLFEWVSCVAYAVLAGLVARMILLPAGPLQDAALWVRLTATAAALAVFFLARQRLLLGVSAGALTLILLHGTGPAPT